MQASINRTHSELRKALEAGQAAARMGTIESYDPATHMVKVTIQPEGILTGWMPINTAWVGNNFGFYVGPNIGDQVTVIHQEGNPGAGMVMGRVNDDDSVPPNVPSGEAHMIHSAGSFLKFTNDGNVSINTHQDLVVTTTGKVNVTSQGDTDITSQGKVSVTSQGDVDVNTQGNANVTAGGNIVLSGNVELGGSGGKKVVLDGDHVSGGVVIASSTKTTAV